VSNRARGDYHERKTRIDLESHGYIVVRSGGSLGPADLVALRHQRPPLFISCKLSGIIRPDENDRTFVAAIRAGAIPLLAQRGDRGRIVYKAITKPKTLRGKHWFDTWLRAHRREILTLPDEGDDVRLSE
jgi:Holliday junction resolvase